MNIVIRADASRVIGSGHVMRSLTLAQALRDSGAAVSFVSRWHEGNLHRLIEERGFRLTRLPAADERFVPASLPSHAAWLGAHWDVDAEQTRRAIESLPARPEWLIVDHYGIDQRWEAALRPSVGRIFVIDDLADREHDCDLLLDQNFPASLGDRYVGKVPAECPVMLGPRFALLQPVYSQLRDRIAPRAGPVRNVLISLGGGDNAALSRLALQAVLGLGRSDIEVDLVASGDDVAVRGVRDLARGHANVRVHAGLPSLAPLIARADLAIGAVGATSWERLSLGLPAIVITLASNQRPIADWLQRLDLVCWLGDREDVTLEKLAKELRARVDAGCDTAKSRAAREMVDAKGLARVTAALLTDAQTPLRVRHAVLSDEALLLEWANEPTTRRHSFSRDLIGAEDHHRWFTRRLRDIDHCLIFIAETTDRVPVGQVRFDQESDGWKVSYSVDRLYRGRGLARRVLELALAELRRIDPAARVFGLVARDNVPSQRVFSGLGFAAEPGEVITYRLSVATTSCR